MAKKIINIGDVHENEPKVKQINANTQIVFTVKSFLATIGTILGIFYGFYQIVVVPKVNLTEQNYSTMFNDQKEQNQIFYQELGKINSSIGALNATVNALNNNKNYNPTQQHTPNTGGSFSTSSIDSVKNTNNQTADN
jgi:hypothetical protein